MNNQKHSFPGRQDFKPLEEEIKEHSSSFHTNTQDVSTLHKHIHPYENNIKFTLYKYALVLLSLLEIWSIAMFCVGVLGGKYATFDLSAGSLSLPLSLWDLYQIYVLQSALTYKNLRRLDRGVRLVKCFMVLVPMFGATLFYYTFYVTNKGSAENIPIVEQVLTVGLAIAVVEGLLFLVYLYPPKKLRELMIYKGSVLEMLDGRKN